jgi:hypothetical protein
VTQARETHKLRCNADTSLVSIIDASKFLFITDDEDKEMAGAAKTYTLPATTNSLDGIMPAPDLKASHTDPLI